MPIITQACLVIYNTCRSKKSKISVQFTDDCNELRKCLQHSQSQLLHRSRICRFGAFLFGAIEGKKSAAIVTFYPYMYILWFQIRIRENEITIMSGMIIFSVGNLSIHEKLLRIRRNHWLFPVQKLKSFCQHPDIIQLLLQYSQQKSYKFRQIKIFLYQSK